MPTCLRIFGKAVAEPMTLPPIRPGLDADIELCPWRDLKEIKPILITPEKQLLCQQDLDRLCAAGFIKPTFVPFAALAFFVQDKA
jgi:hypothetical protein